MGKLLQSVAVGIHMCFLGKSVKGISDSKIVTKLILMLYVSYISKVILYGIRGFLVKINKEKKKLNDVKPPITLPDRYRGSQLPFPFFK